MLFSTFFLVVSSRSPRNISLFNLNVCCGESWENEMILGNSKPLFFRCTSIYLSIIIIMSSCLLRLFVFTFRSCFSSFYVLFKFFRWCFTAAYVRNLSAETRRDHFKCLCFIVFGIVCLIMGNTKNRRDILLFVRMMISLLYCAKFIISTTHTHTLNFLCL